MLQSVKIVPFTDAELREIQLTIADRILDLGKNSELETTSDRDNSVFEEMQTLRRVIEKCRNHCVEIRAAG